MTLGWPKSKARIVYVDGHWSGMTWETEKILGLNRVIYTCHNQFLLLISSLNLLSFRFHNNTIEIATLKITKDLHVAKSNNQF